MATKEQLQDAIRRAQAANDPEAVKILQSDLEDVRVGEGGGGPVEAAKDVARNAKELAQAVTPAPAGGGGPLEFAKDLNRSTQRLREAVTPAPAGGGGPIEFAKDVWRNAVENIPNAVESAGGVIKGWGLGAKQLVTPKDYSPGYIDISKRVNKHIPEQTERESKPGGMVGAMLPEAVLALVPGLGEAGAAKLLTKVPRVVEAFNAAKEIPVAGKVLSAASLPFKRPFTGATGGAAASSFEPRASDQSQLLQTLLMTGGGAVGDLTQALGGRLVTPFRTTNAERNAAAMRLRERGIDSSLGQQTGSPTANAVEIGLNAHPLTAPFTIAGKPKQKGQIATAGGKFFGAEPDPSGTGLLTEKVMGDATDTMGRRFDAAQGHPGGPLDTPYALDINKTARDVATVRQGVGPGKTIQGEDTLRAQEQRIADAAGVGTPPSIGPTGRTVNGKPVMGPVPASPNYQPPRTVSGAEYTALRKTLSNEVVALRRAGHSDAAGMVDDILDANDEWAARTMKNIVGPDGKIVDMAELRKQWGAYKDVANSLNPDGSINTSKLGATQDRKLGKAGNVSGKGDEFSQFARDARLVFGSQGPDSGTAKNLMMARLLEKPFVAGGALLGGAGLAGAGAMQPEDVWGKVGGGVTLATALGLTNSKLGKRYMTNALLNEGLGKKLAKSVKYSGGFAGSQMFKDKEDKLPDWLRRLTDEEN